MYSKEHRTLSGPGWAKTEQQGVICFAADKCHFAGLSRNHEGHRSSPFVCTRPWADVRFCGNVIARSSSSALWCSVLSLRDGAGALLFRFASHEVRAQLEIGGRARKTASLDLDRQIRQGENGRLALDHALRGAEFRSIARSSSYPSSNQSQFSS